ncbi:hypothetical protein MGMO_173c00080 [Methyloglobulus morosus KoM1]|uniref:TIGR02646 family protein n=1 Tax=Methyloglobulus morosus KoM1 TaxID=1116472 RepID=V5BH37_9GAMM|nr:retron system putative HNH endonuclease [Methyloglobulus morosus]ESS67029.1 hypothetical protein MGMO_173c00080 [Methyloglobulus morosus KoM1]
MKTCLKGKIPNLLTQYQSNNPDANWEQFKNECQQGYRDVQSQLRQDQGNLCCYCEIETRQAFGIGKDDFRVEHFHPKSDIVKSGASRNWGLDWRNMLGCCHGGSERYVTDAQERYISINAQRHSDTLKGEFILDDEILNPLTIPPFPILFKANRRDGSFSVLEDNCRNADVSIDKANGCLAADKLNLNSEKLKELRKKAMDALNEQIQEEVSRGLSIEQAMSNVTKAQLRKNAQQYWPAFFTTIRSYLGAENFLQSIQYSG